MESQGEITLALAKLRKGEPDAKSRLISLVYDELRRLAGAQLRRERLGHTLQSTALVHEVYLRLLGKNRCNWQDRAHFFAAAAAAMRHILVDHARAAKALRRGGDGVRVEMTELMAAIEAQSDDILSVDSALEKLGRLSPRQVTVVEMRFYAGFTEEEVAAILKVSTRTVKRDWEAARTWLHREIHGFAGAET